MSDELDFWRYRAFKLAQALCSSNFDSTAGTFGREWYELGADTQEHYRELGLDEHHLLDPKRNEWNPEWVNGQNGST